MSDQTNTVNGVLTSSTLILPKIMRFDNVRLYIFSAAFISLDVLAPWVTHHFGGVQAGSTFLPMFFFILLAGLLAGWRAGLVVGLLTPLISFGVSGMPLLAILPQISMECAIYGLVIGLLRERFHLRVIWSLLGAIISGRLARLALASLLFLFYGGEISPFTYIWLVVLQGLPGVAIQLTFIPLIVRIAEKQYHRRSHRNRQLNGA